MGRCSGKFEGNLARLVMFIHVCELRFVPLPEVCSPTNRERELGLDRRETG